MVLSVATVLLWTSDLTDLACIGQTTKQLVITSEVPSAICEYEERVKKKKTTTKSIQAYDFDLSKEPPGEPILDLSLCARNQRDGQSDYAQNALGSSSRFHNVIKVVHLEETAEDMMIACVTCLCLYEEVLLVSVSGGYLWLTMKAEGSMSEMFGYKHKCQLIQSFPPPTCDLDDFQSLQPLFIDEVVSVYGGKRSYHSESVEFDAESNMRRKRKKKAHAL